MPAERVITIDGPSGTGKSTASKILAERLGFQYLDTGALYRAVALYLRSHNVDENAGDEVINDILRGLEVGLSGSNVYVNGMDVSEEIRTPEIGHFSSVFSARGPVRRYLLEIQRAYPEKKKTVAEGRDMGTVVFPEAWRKFFLDASPEVRADRRYRQLKDQGKGITREIALKDVMERDERDSRRELSPLKKAADAVLIDNTGMGIEETVDKMLEFI